ncbi:hypothetical protein RFI_21407 [Reticulomyxa filosa]|uniref:Saposin B-type domain-containing protein n=1 Tax=Reticulomyxa filosa TaxID=46433 RepID=X6MS99_RETFI|nr:hypothetical protein RFI_21407 [Reticulomyxa filosa]|eukprot:ETO15955.1 hypothetical protein RFI_21407 [Reticulomyxa filosa]
MQAMQCDSKTLKLCKCKKHCFFLKTKNSNFNLHINIISFFFCAYLQTVDLLHTFWSSLQYKLFKFILMLMHYQTEKLDKVKSCILPDLYVITTLLVFLFYGAFFEFEVQILHRIMRKMYVWFQLLLLYVFVTQICNGYDEMQEMMGQYMERSQQKRAKPHRKWFKYIQCQVCEEAAKQLTRHIKPSSSSSTRKTEEQIYETMDKVCNPYEDEKGGWITMHDLVLEEGKLQMKHINLPNTMGHCGSECETIAYTCSKILEDKEIELSEALYSNPTRSNVRNVLCPNYCKKEKTFTIKMDSKNSKVWSEKWREADPEQRQMIKIADTMPGNVKMLDPSAMMFDDMYNDMGDLYDYSSLYSQPPLADDSQESDTPLNMNFNFFLSSHCLPFFFSLVWFELFATMQSRLFLYG